MTERAKQASRRSTPPRDEWLYPILEDMDRAVDPHNLKAGENIYMLTLLLFGSIQDAPSDIRELFRGAAVQLLLREKGSGDTLRMLCLDGRLS